MKKILVVDDDHDISAVVKMILVSKGYDVLTHDTGLHVPDIVNKFQPNLILLDVRLPGKFGTQVCQELKEVSDYPPILLFSAHAKEGDSFAICNADGFIQKPFEVKQLISVIQEHVG